MTAIEISNHNQLYMALGYCAFMLVLGLLFQKFPPKKINYLYGYRTNRSMKNQEVWEAANNYASKLFLRICLYSFLLPVVSYFLFPQYNILITIIVNTLLLFFMMYSTETYLKEYFDADGNPLS